MDAFLSYKHDDSEWAKRLHRELERQQLRVFIDTRDLVAAREWEQQLDDAIDEAKAMVVLWSSKAQNLDYTDRERHWFDRAELKTSRLQTRPVVFVLLDAIPGAIHREQMITDLKQTGAYPGSPDAVPDHVWQTVASRVRQAVLDDVTVVHTLILAARGNTLTAEHMGQDRWQRMEATFAQLGFGGVAARYGETPLDWRPHGKDTVREMLNTLEAGLSAEFPLRLENVNHAFEHQNPDDLRDAARGLSHKLALIVVDAFSLQDLATDTLFKCLDPCHQSRTNAFAVFAPQAADDKLLNEQLRIQAAELYKSFFRPIPYREDQPSIGLNLRNTKELERLLLIAISRQANRATPRRRSSVVLGGAGSR